MAVVVVCLAAGGVLAGRELASGSSPPAPPLPAATAAFVRHAVDPVATAPPVGRVRFPTTRSGLTWQRRQITLSVGGRRRSSLLLTPAAGVRRRLPIVVELAGAYVTAAEEAARADYAAVTGPAVLVYPQDIGPGREDNWDAGACCGMAAAKHVDDVGFIAAVIRRVRSSVPHEGDAPVYLSGYSNGGKMALRMACTDPGLFRAVAVYGAVESLICHGDRPPPMSVLEMVGTDDPWTALDAASPPVTQRGFPEPTVAQEAGFYVRADHCAHHVAEGSAGPVTELRWVDCAGARQVGVAVWNDQNHGWPQKDGSEPSAQQVAWDFFRSLGA